MKIVILGNGKVGSKIYELCREFGIPIKSIVSPNNPHSKQKKISDVAIDEKDTIIDFSSAQNVVENIEYSVEHRANYVMGTTGWGQHEEAIKSLVKDKIGFVYTPNYLPVVHNFWRNVENFATSCGNGTHVSIFERRLHTKTSASHTAQHICEIIKSNPTIEFSKENHFFSTLSGYKAIDIDIYFLSEAWNHSMHFEALDAEKNNLMYATMALKTAKWLQKKKGFFILDKNQIDDISKISLS